MSAHCPRNAARSASLSAPASQFRASCQSFISRIKRQTQRTESLCSRLMMLRACLAMLLMALMPSLSAAVSWTSTSQTNTGGTAGSNGTWTAGLNYSVNSGVSGDAVNKVELREGDTILTFATFSVSHTPDGDPVNSTRTGTLSWNFGPGTHFIYLRAYTTEKGTGNSPTYTVTVAPNGSPPTVSMTAPTNGSVFYYPATGVASVLVSGSASSSTATITKLEILTNGVVAASVAASSISTSVGVGFGSQSIALRATASNGLTATSEASNITVKPVGDPQIGMISPLNNSSYTVGSNGLAIIPVSGNVFSTNGSIISIEVLDGSAVLASTGGGESINTTVALPPGSHSIALRATNNFNVTGTGLAAAVTVPQPPLPAVSMTAPANPTNVSVPVGASASITVSGSASVAGGAIGQIDVLDGGTVVATTSASSINSTVSLGSGSHSISLRATSGFGTVASSAVSTVNVTAVSAPSTSMTAPANPTNVSVPAGSTASVSVSGSASSANGSITKIDVLDGSTVIATVNAASINTTVSLGGGSHSISLRATNNVGTTGSTAASAVNVTEVGAPSVSMTAPANPTNVSVPAGSSASVSVAGSASSSNGSITKIDVLDGSAVIATVNAASINTTVSLGGGSHSISLRATNSVGVTGSTGAAAVTVTQVGAPSVSMTVPANPTNVSVPTGSQASVSVSGSASSSNGSITKIDVLDGSAVIATINASSVNTTVSLGGGGHSISLRATNNVGATGASVVSTVNVTEVGAPSVSITMPVNPTNVSVPEGSSASVLVWGSASSSNGSINKIEVLDGNAVVASVSAASISAAVSLAGGSHSIVLRATNNVGATGNSAASTVNVTQVGAPSVSMTSPTSSLSFNVANEGLSASVQVSGSASSTNGSITKLEVLEGSAVLAAIESSSVNTTVPLAIGTHGISLRATNSVGVTSTSPVSMVNVYIATAISATPLPVAITPPHLGNADAGTLPGNLSVSNAGAATYSIAIAVPPGTAALAPSLSLNYSSQATNGMVGLGWSISGLSSIHRCGKTIAQDGVNDRIRFAGSDRLCLDSQRLILKGQAATDDAYWADGAEFRTEIDSFSRITAVGPVGNRSYKVEAKDGRIMTYGGTTGTVNAVIGAANSGTTAPPPQPKSGPLSWAVERVQDRAGNYISFTYAQDMATGEHLPSVIRYGGSGMAAHAAVQFTYEDRPDAWKKYLDEARNDMRSRVSHIKAYIGTGLNGDVSAGTLVKDYALRYEQSPTSGRSLLASVQACGRNPQSGAIECLPETTFNWGKPDPSKPASVVNRGIWSGAPILTTWRVYTDILTPHKNSLIRADFFSFADFENHGRMDVLEKRVATREDDRANSVAAGTIKDQYRYFHNTGSGYAQYDYRLDTGESFVVNNVGDVNGDGAPDLVVLTGSNEPKVCLSPLARPSGLPAAGNPIVFTCDPNLKAIGGSLVKQIPYVVDVLGDGRAAQYSRVALDGSATLCMQGSCVTDTRPPANILGRAYTYVEDLGDDPQNFFIGFEQSVDFSGTGKHSEVRWTRPYFLGAYRDSEGVPVVYNKWVNTTPEISVTGFLAPGSVGDAGRLASFKYPDYQPACQNTRQEPYYFERPSNAATLAADFSGSGYNGLMFGYAEYGYDDATCQRSVTKSELNVCLSTGRALDCGVRNKYSGANYRAVRAVGNFVGDGAPAVLVETVLTPPGSLPTPSGAAELCRVTGDDTTNGMGVNDTNITCEPWPGVTLPRLQAPPGSTAQERLDRQATDQLYLMDLLGTGREQLVIYHSGVFEANGNWREDGRWELFEPVDRAVAGQALDRVYQVTNGLGQVSSVEYVDGVASGVVSQTNGNVLGYPQRAIPGVGKIVAKLRVGNGISGSRTTSYKYYDAAVDVAGRGALGFATVESTDVDTGIVTTSRYAQPWPFTGLLKSSTVVANGCTLRDTTNRLASKATTGGATFVYVAGSTEAHRDLDRCLLTHSVTVSGASTADVQYDGDGNLLDSQTTTEGGGQLFKQQTVKTYFAADVPNWLIGLVQRSATTKMQSSDGRSITRVMAYTYDAAGRVETETSMPDDTGATMKLVATYDRSTNAFGLVGKRTQQWTDPLTKQAVTRSDSTTYDMNGRYPATMANTAGHSESRVYEAGTGAQLSVIGPNLLTTVWEVDAFGRVTSERHPGGNEIRQYRKQCDSQCPEGAAATSIIERFNGADRVAVPSLSYADNAGHLLRTLTWGFDGRAIAADSRYDSLGRLRETDQPHYTADAATLAQRQTYDILDRVRSAVSRDEQGVEQTNTTVYQGLVTINTNAKNQTRTDTRNALGQVVQVVDAKAGTSKFAYDPFGNLVQTIDPNGNVINVVFDDLGRRIQLRDPDLGQSDYTVDAAGRTRRQVNPVQRARGQSTDMQYDALDRMTLRLEPDLESHWEFDTAAMGVGQLAEAYTVAGQVKDYRRVHAYDSLGRPSTTTQFLVDTTYSGRSTYDAWGRAVRQTLQRGSDPAKVFDTRYNDKGYPARIERSGVTLWEAKRLDASQRVTQALLGNGLWQQDGYDAYTGRLTSATLMTAAGIVRLQEGYGYDALGNVMQRSQSWGSMGFTEAFHYDELNRLDWSEVNGQSRQNFVYDPAGNLTSKTGVGTGNYVYPVQGIGATRPHAVQSIPGLGNFVYDDNGNLTAGAGRTATWTTFDMPVTVTKAAQSSNFAYGPEHQRARQTKQDGSKIVYASAQEVELDGSNQVVSVKTYWPMGLGVEIDKPNVASQLNWVHHDRLGSAVAITDADGALKEKLAYDAWGKRRTLDGAPISGSATPDSIDGQVDNKGFTGHEMLDQLDLVHMNGRVYDPFTARFMSGDPLVQDPVNGQSYNRYSYVLNNPTNLTDPTGFACQRTPAGDIPGIPFTCPDEAEKKVEKVVKSVSSGEQKGHIIRVVDKDGKVVEEVTVTRSSDGHGVTWNSSLAINANAKNPSSNSDPKGVLNAAKDTSPFSAANLLRAASLGGETRLEQAANADAVGFLDGEISSDELRTRQENRAVGGVIGLAAGATVTVTLDALAANAARQLIKQRAGDIGRDIIGWGRGQGAADVAQTIARTEGVTARVVERMIRQGLDRAWVEKQAAAYTNALESGTRRVINEQLVPRLELMRKILENWPK